jgi:hypothetical protein
MGHSVFTVSREQQSRDMEVVYSHHIGFGNSEAIKSIPAGNIYASEVM